MSATLPGGDVRAFYAALGVELPGWAQREAPVGCFADPDAHAHQDRDPSCSVNVHSGAFKCHGCGARGGAYDAALAIGYPRREAIELMITHGLTERRPPGDMSGTTSPTHACGPSRGSAANPNSEPAAATPPHPAAPPSEAHPRMVTPAAGAPDRQGASSLWVSAKDVRRWAWALCRNGDLLVRVGRERGWEPETLANMEIGFDGDRITVPITDEHRTLQGLLRLRVETRQTPKVRTTYGTRLGLIPDPKLVEGPVVLVEGPSDMLAARSAGLPAIAVPGTHAWRADWASMFCGRDVTVVMDADRAGRHAAARIARDLQAHGARTTIVDLDPTRDDGYDLSDWLRAGNKPAALPNARAFASGAASGRSVANSHDHRPQAAGAAAPTANRVDQRPLGAVTAPSLGLRGSIRCAAL